MALAERYGFSSHAHLSRAFRLHFGYTPSDVRGDPAIVLKSRSAGATVATQAGVPGFDDWIRSLRG